MRLTWGLLSVLIFIYMADFSCKMNNKRIIEFGSRRISELFRPRSALSASASADNADLALNNSDILLSLI